MFQRFLSNARLTGDAQLCNKISSEDARESCLSIVCIIKGASSREECLSDQGPAGTAPPTTAPPPTTTPPPTTMPPMTAPPIRSPPITKSPPPAEPILEIIDTTTVDNPDMKLWVTGKIKNKGGADAFSVRIILTVFDDHGKKLDWLSTAPIEKIAPGETIEFNVLKSNILNTAVGRYEVTFEFEQ